VPLVRLRARNSLCYLWRARGQLLVKHSVQKWLGGRTRNVYGDVLLGVEALTARSSSVWSGCAMPSRKPGCAELDIYLGEKEYRGRGYATDAMRTVCHYGVEKMSLHKITLTVVAENHSARRVHQKIDFFDECRLRQEFRRDGRWYGMFTMGLLEGGLCG